MPRISRSHKQHKGLPANYEGAYEKHLNEKSQNTVAALEEATFEADAVIASFMARDACDAAAAARASVPSGGEHAETAAPATFALRTLDTYATKNPFEEFQTNDDEHTDLITAVSQLTPRNSTGPKTTQRQRSIVRAPRTRSQIAPIANDVNEGNIILPDITPHG